MDADSTNFEMNSSRIVAPQVAPQVPLPNEIPNVPDFSSLPPSILHSGTVETLIAINDDLMARLKINIRRNSVLEGQILELEKIQDEFAMQNQSLAQQLELIREKGQRTDQLSTRIAQLQEEKRQLLSRIKNAATFKRRVVRWVKPSLQKIASSQAKLRQLETVLENREAQLSDTRARMLEAVTHIQNLDKISAKDQARIVEQYESKQLLLEKELERALSDSKSFREKAQRVEQATAAKANAENHLILIERRNQELEARLQKQIAQIQTEASQYRQEAKGLAIENLELNRNLNDKMIQAENQSASLERIQDQFESLQALYLESQKRLEASKLAQDNLSRLNQELSKQLKNQLVSHHVIDVEPAANPAQPRFDL